MAEPRRLPADMAGDAAVRSTPRSSSDESLASLQSTTKAASPRRGCTDVIVAVLTVSDFTDLLIISGPSALLPEIGSALGFGSAASSQIAAAFTAATCVGKLISGSLIDLVGGKTALLFGLVMISVSAVAISVCTSSWWIAVCFAVMGFCHSPVYPSQALIVREQLPAQQFAGMFRWLGITSRTGSFVCMLGFSATLKLASWRSVLRASACTGGVAALVVWAYAGGPRASRPDQEDKTECSAVASPLRQGDEDSSGGASSVGDGHDSSAPRIRGWSERRDDSDRQSKPSRRPPFITRVRRLFSHKWYCAAIAASMFVTGIIELTLIMSTYFNDTCHGVQPSMVPALASGFPAGLLASNLGPGYVYKQLRSYRQKRVLCLSLQALSVLSTVCLAMIGDQATSSDFMLGSKVVLTFGVAFGVGISWYIPIPTAGAALAPNDTGLCQALVDGSGLLAAVVFQMITSRFLKPNGGGWCAVMLMSVAWNMAGLLLMNQFYHETEPLMTGDSSSLQRSSSTRHPDHPGARQSADGGRWSADGYQKLSTSETSEPTARADGRKSAERSPATASSAHSTVVRRNG